MEKQFDKTLVLVISIVIACILVILLIAGVVVKTYSNPDTFRKYLIVSLVSFLVLSIIGVVVIFSSQISISDPNNLGGLDDDDDDDVDEGPLAGKDKTDFTFNPPVTTAAPTDDPEGTGDATGLVGALCRDRTDCASDACGYDIAVPGASKKCCEDGAGSEVVNEKRYCAGRADGVPCPSHETCASGKCLLGTCGLKGIGERCETKPDCANAAQCVYYDADHEYRICTHSITEKYVGGEAYNSEVPDGGRCWISEMCANGVCRADGKVSTTSIKGWCGIGEDGERCSIDSDCKNDYCGVPNGYFTYHGGEFNICCPTGDHQRYWGSLHDFCTYPEKTQVPGGVCPSNGDDNNFSIDSGEEDDQGNKIYFTRCEHGCGQVGSGFLNSREWRYECCSSAGSSSGIFGEWCNNQSNLKFACGYDDSCKSGQYCDNRGFLGSKVGICEYD
jgi:hypothetical protein